ncbi:MazG-like family protein [Petroclostridium sp. X23]|uniref:MazG-like family protein n=1 Tax=Petroclostridium sp. X23 TaxID=3045146 RepID=UPI0024AE8566|nr:MazG-like family protein [Petroclostridium sp. X23]WHH57552.1 MazG-like family protein [Petroclostridium sp. X23]
MSLFDRDLDITRNIKMIEWLKSELLTDIAALFKALMNGMKDDAQDILAETISNLIVICYLLGKRLGISYHMIDLKMEDKLRLGIIEGHELEKSYKDLSELSKHLNSTRDKNRSSHFYK